MSPTGTWTNWARNQHCTPQSVASPASTDELAAVIKAAADAGRRVKPVGAGHSFTSIAATDGVQLRLDKLTGIVSADAESGLVTLYAGTRLRDIPGLLAPYGLAMENLGDIDAQTISGATSTGTHGTGLRFGGLATQIRALSLVLADGSLLECSATDRPSLFAAARVGLGALGVVVTVTLQCVPAFRLRAAERPVPFAEMLSTFERRYREHDHVEFYWFPHTDWTLYKEDTRLPGAEPVSPPSRVRGYIDDELLSNTAFEGLCRLGHTFPALIPHTAGIAARALSAREYVDVSHAVLTSPRRVRFREMEYAVPREAIGDVLCDVRAMIERREFRISFPIEIRVAAADDIWLSTGFGRENAYIAVHQYWRTPFGEYFSSAEEIFKAAGGRPHWGKLHTLTSDDFAERYPHFADFQRVRDELDPERRFANAYLDGVLGT